LNFGETAAVSFFAREPRRHKRADNIERQLNSNHARAQTQHIAIVVFA
jgi:hypothetical protein